MSTWVPIDSVTTRCTTCGATFPVGRSCACPPGSAVSPPPASAPQASHPTAGAEGGLLAADGSQLPAQLRLEEVEQRIASCANRARDVFRKMAKIVITEPVGKAKRGRPTKAAAAKASASDREMTRRRGQLVAIDTEIKALRYCGELAIERARIDRRERALAESAAIRRLQQGGTN
jgi:hypothetical protein